MWHLIVLVPDHCLSFHFTKALKIQDFVLVNNVMIMISLRYYIYFFALLNSYMKNSFLKRLLSLNYGMHVYGSCRYGLSLHGPSMLVDKTNFGLVLYNCAYFYRFEGKHLVIGQLNEYQFFSAFQWSTSDTNSTSQCIIVQ